MLEEEPGVRGCADALRGPGHPGAQAIAVREKEEGSFFSGTLRYRADTVGGNQP